MRKGSRCTISGAAPSTSRSSRFKAAFSTSRRPAATPISAAKTSTSGSSTSLPRNSRKKHGIDLRKDRMALQRLREAAEKAKHELSSSLETEINIPFIASGPTGPLHLERTMKRSELEILTRDLVDRTISACRTRARRRQAHRQGDRSGRAGRRHDANAGGAEGGEGAVRPRPAQGGQSRRGGGGRRGNPRRRARRRDRRGAAARRDAAVDRRRNRRRRVHQADPAQHHRPDRKERDLHDQRRQPVVRADPRAAGRARDGRRQPQPGALRAHRHPARAARRAQDSGHLPHRRQRHSLGRSE